LILHSKRFIRLFLIFLFAFSQISADVYRREIPPYANIDVSKNKIFVPGGDSTRLDNVFRKIDSIYSLGYGRVNILHIGGSHVQAGTFTDRIRKNLDILNNGLQPPRGFVFPYSAAHTNNPASYSVSYTGAWEGVRNVSRNRSTPLGLSGIAAYTSDPQASVCIRLNSDSTESRWHFNHLSLIGSTLDGISTVKPVLTSLSDTTLTAETDSTSNVCRFALPYDADSFTIAFEQTDSMPSTFVLRGFITDADEAGIVYNAIGVNGASLKSYLDCEYFEDDLKLIAPDLVVFGIGINDAAGKYFTEDAFINNYNDLINRILNINPNCAFIFITNNDSFRKISRRKYAVNQRGETVRQAFYELARQHKGGVWDQFSIMGGLGSMKKWEQAGLAQHDKVHFTSQGYKLLGDLFYNALADYWLKEVEK